MSVNISDSFPQADEDPLSSGGNWIALLSGSMPKVVSNRLRANAVADDFSMARYNTVISDNQFARVKVPSWNNSSSSSLLQIRLFIRTADDPTDTHYELDIVKVTGVSANFQVYKAVAAVYTQIAGPTDITFTAGDGITAYSNGQDLVFYQNLVKLTSLSDASIASGKIVIGFGIFTGGAITDIELDDFIGGAASEQQYYPPTIAQVGAGGFVGHTYV